MHRTPSNADLQQLVVDLCRAAVMLRMAESRGCLEGDGESGRLADGIDKWFTACEHQISEILEPAPDQPPADDNVVNLAGARAKRGVAAADAPRISGVIENAPEKALDRTPSEQHWAELRAQLRLIASSMTSA